MSKTNKQLRKENQKLLSTVKLAADLEVKVAELEQREFNRVISANEGCPEGYKNIKGHCVKVNQPV